MRNFKRNQKPFKSAFLIGKTDVYKTDASGNIEYTTSIDGTQIPITDGQKELIYENPIDFVASISMGGSESEVQYYGIDMSSYEAILTYKLGSVSLKEGALIWWKSEPTYKYASDVEITYKGKTYNTKAPESKSADYMVAKIISSLNEERAILKAVIKE